MKIQFLGAAGIVTGSSYVLTSGSGQSLLIDLGMFQGEKVDSLNYQPYAYDCSMLAGAVLTHAHLDHCGRLPLLLKNRYPGQIWMTQPTADLAELALLDSAKIAKMDAKPVLYDRDLAIQTISQFHCVGYLEPFHIGSFTITMRDAGHILGSASLVIVDNSPDGEIQKIVFSGDLGNSPDDLLHQIDIPQNADAVVMESTYGDRLHPTENPIDSIAREVSAVEDSGGTLLIPSFSIHRTQELLHAIMHLKLEGKIKITTPVFLDSPMGASATMIYTRYPKDCNEHIQKELAGKGPFGFPGLVYVDRRKESQAIHKQKGPKVIIAGSGMMTGGRIVGHAAHYLPKSSTRLLIVGYQGEGTLGRELLERHKNVMIDRKQIHVNGAVNDIQTMSSHADQQQLLDWLRGIGDVKKIFLTHGDDIPRAELAKKITSDLGITDIALPSMNQVINCSA